MKSPITIVILTFNETVNIADCLNSVAWADDVIVVDSGSTDDTVALARRVRLDVRVFEHPFQDFGDQRNWALDNTNPKNEWILFLDADERITSACAEAIQNAIRNPEDQVGFFLSCRNFFLGKWIKHCSLYPSWQLRLLKKGQVRYRKEGHGQREVTDGLLGYIREPYDHFGFSKGVAEWSGRHNRYSTEEVELLLQLRARPLGFRDLFGAPVLRRRFLKRLAARVGCRPVTRFIYGYLIRGGFLDGRAGYIFCLLRVGQEIQLVAKLAEREVLERQTAHSNAQAPAGSEKHRVDSGGGYHDQLAETWTSKYRSPSFSERADVTLGLLEGIDVRGGYWLDAGCGTGVLSMMLAARSCRVLGVDSSPVMIAQARQQLASFDNVSMKEAVKFEEIETIERMAIPDGTFSGVLCSSVVEYLGDPVAAIREMYRVLKPGGLLIVSLPNRGSLWRRIERLIWLLTGRTWPAYLSFSRQSFSRQEIDMLLKSAGFSVRRASGFAPRLPAMIRKHPWMSTLFIVLAEKRVAD